LPSASSTLPFAYHLKELRVCVRTLAALLLTITHNRVFIY